MSVTKIPQSKSLWGLTIGNAQKHIDELDLSRYPEFKHLLLKNTKIGTITLADRKTVIDKYVEKLVIDLPIIIVTGIGYMIVDGKKLPILETYGYFKTFCCCFVF